MFCLYAEITVLRWSWFKPASGYEHFKFAANSSIDREMEGWQKPEELLYS